MANHKHKAKPSLHRIVGWSYCVAATPERACQGDAHGAVVHVDTCSCGATRKIESNGRYSASSGWIEAGAPAVYDGDRVTRGTRIRYPDPDASDMEWNEQRRRLGARGLHLHDDGNGYVVARGSRCLVSGSTRLCEEAHDQDTE